MNISKKHVLVIITGPPVSEEKKSQKSFSQCRDELVASLCSDDVIYVSLASSFCSHNIIEKVVRDKVRKTKGKVGATMLVDNVEQAVRKRPEILPKILEIMDEEDALRPIAMKIRGSTEEKDHQVVITGVLYSNA